MQVEKEQYFLSKHVTMYDSLFALEFLMAYCFVFKRKTCISSDFVLQRKGELNKAMRISLSLFLFFAFRMRVGQNTKILLVVIKDP